MGLVVYTGGTFDLIHSGHVEFLKACRRLAGNSGRVIVSLNSDAFIEAYKGRRPVMSFDERATVLRELRSVDQVIENWGGADSKQAIEFVAPDYITLGMSAIILARWVLMNSGCKRTLVGLFIILIRQVFRLLS